MPASLPLPKQPDSVTETDKGDGVDAEPTSTSSKEMHAGTRPPKVLGSKLKDLPEGFMGKILVYRSGKVKMKIGDSLFDVSMKTLCPSILSLCFPWPHAISKLKQPCRSLRVQIACLSRRLRQLTPEKSTAAPWERSASARL